MRRELAHTLLRTLAQDEADLDLEAGLDLVTLGTVAAVVPLSGGNRVLMRWHLPQLARAAWPGLCTLLEVSGVSRLVLTPHDIAFGVEPHLKAPDRRPRRWSAVARTRWVGWACPRRPQPPLRYVHHHWRAYFPRVLSQRAFNRRARGLMGVLCAPAPLVLLSQDPIAPRTHAHDGRPAPEPQRLMGRGLVSRPVG